MNCMTRYDKYIDRDVVKRELERKRTITLEELHGLAEMAANNVYPDGSFSDDHCVAWEIIKNALRKTNGN